MADAPEHYISRPGQSGHSTLEHNPYDPYSPVALILEGKIPAGSNTADYGDNSYEMKQSVAHNSYEHPDPEIAKSSKVGRSWKNRMVCDMRMKWFLILMAAFVLGAIAATLAGVLGSEKAIEDNKKKIAAAAAASASDEQAATASIPTSKASEAASTTHTACSHHKTHASSSHWYTLSNPSIKPSIYFGGAFDAASNFSSVKINPESRKPGQEWFFMRIQDANPLSRTGCEDGARTSVLYWITNHPVPKSLDVRLGLDSSQEQFLTGKNRTEMNVEFRLAPMDEKDETQLWWIETFKSTEGPTTRVKNCKSGREWTLRGDERNENAYLFSGGKNSQKEWWNMNQTTKIEEPWFGVLGDKRR